MTEEKQVISAMKEQQGKDATRAKKSNTRKQTSRQGETTSKTSCKYCGWQHEKGAAKCPAYGKTYAKCKKKNHMPECAEGLVRGNPSSKFTWLKSALTLTLRTR